MPVRCLDHPDGLALATREGEPFLVLNGIQTQSYRVLNLADALPDMRELGVDAVRLSPQPEHMDEVIAAFRAALDGAAAADVAAALAPALPARAVQWLLARPAGTRLRRCARPPDDPPCPTHAAPSAVPGAAAAPAACLAHPTAFVLPLFVRAVTSRLPAFPAAVAGALTLSLIAPRIVGRDALATLEGRTFRIVVRDAGTGVAFRDRAGALRAAAPRPQAVDVTFTANAADFLRLATRRADPDTLFFDRRLLIEGDTETGLQLKNMLDAVELPRWLTGA